MRPVLATALLCVACGFAGCSAGPGAHARVSKSPAPPLAASGVAPALPEKHSMSGWTMGREEAEDSAGLKKWFAAREAFWNYDTDTAVKLLRELREEKVVNDEHFADLARQCYQLSERWADGTALDSELGKQVEFFRFRAGLPPREMSFAADVAPVPFTFESGALVVVEAEINGRRARLMVDTGAEMTWLSTSFAREAGVTMFDHTINLQDATGSGRRANVGLLQRLELGGMTVTNLPIIGSTSLFLALGAGVDGILGWDVLQQADVTWDFPAQRLTLAAPRGGMSETPTLFGRRGPIFRFSSAEGRPLFMFFDSGATSGNGFIDLYENDGVLATKTNLASFRHSWRPVFQTAMHSFSVSWPRRAKPFVYWMDGYRFEMPGAWLVKGVERYEMFGCLDGTVGNLPFLQGKLRLCGVRREASFELTQPATVARRATIPPALRPAADLASTSGR
jgi:hypothetical protein